MGITTTEYECEHLVKTQEVTANGATFGDPISMGREENNHRGQCWAQFGNNYIEAHSYWKTCFFDGILL